MRGRAHSQSAARCPRRICSKKEKEAKKKGTISILVQPVLSFPVFICLVLYSLSLSLSHHRPLVYSSSLSLLISPLSFLSVLSRSVESSCTFIFVAQLSRCRFPSVSVARHVSLAPSFVPRIPSSLPSTVLHPFVYPSIASSPSASPIPSTLAPTHARARVHTHTHAPDPSITRFSRSSSLLPFASPAPSRR